MFSSGEALTGLVEKVCLGPWNKSPLGSGAHRAGGGKVRLSTMIRLGPGYVFFILGEALAGLEVERSVSDLGIKVS